MLGVTIAALTGSDSAPAKANEAKQKNDIGAARDQVYLFASNAQTEAYERIYVKGKQAVSNADVTASNASTEVSKFVKDKIDKEYGTAKTVGLATIVATDDGATITISTTDWKQEGNVADTGGTLTWKELTDNTPTVAQKKIGDAVNYSTSLNGVTLDDWHVFFVDGNYTYIIYDDYLPNNAVSSTIQSNNNLWTNETYVINGTNSRADLVNVMITKDNWRELITNGKINNVNLSNDIKLDTTNVFAMGSPTVDLWVNSWNEQYQTDTLQTAQTTSAMSDSLNGYYIGYSATTTNIDLSSKTGYNNTLYFPHKEGIDNDNCFGYWFASPSALDTNSVIGLGCYGSVGDIPYYDGAIAFRPVIKLPTSVVNQ